MSFYDHGWNATGKDKVERKKHRARLHAETEGSDNRRRKIVIRLCIAGAIILIAYAWVLLRTPNLFG